MNKQKVTVKEVAKRANVSLGTVSNVLNDPSRVSKSTRERVMKAIE
jgi:LacI family transcriptional regulator